MGYGPDPSVIAGRRNRGRKTASCATDDTGPQQALSAPCRRTDPTLVYKALQGAQTRPLHLEPSSAPIDYGSSVERVTTPIFDSNGGGDETKELLAMESDASQRVSGAAALSAPARAAARAPAPTVYRDDFGFVITHEKWVELQRTKRGGYRTPGEKARKMQKKAPADAVAWGRGLAQEDAEIDQQRLEERIANAPFASYDLDDEYDRELRAQHRADDPLLYFPAEEGEEGGAHNGSGSEADDSPERPLDAALPLPETRKGALEKCPFPAPSNRFGLLPGYRWDGVVRGNGFEERFILARNAAKAKTKATVAVLEDVTDYD